MVTTKDSLGWSKERKVSLVDEVLLLGGTNSGNTLLADRLLSYRWMDGAGVLGAGVGGASTTDSSSSFLSASRIRNVFHQLAKLRQSG